MVLNTQETLACVLEAEWSLRFGEVFFNSLYRKLSLIAPFEKGEQQEVQPHVFLSELQPEAPDLEEICRALLKAWSPETLLKRAEGDVLAADCAHGCSGTFLPLPSVWQDCCGLTCPSHLLCNGVWMSLKNHKREKQSFLGFPCALHCLKWKKVICCSSPGGLIFKNHCRKSSTFLRSCMSAGRCWKHHSGGEAVLKSHCDCMIHTECVAWALVQRGRANALLSRGWRVPSVSLLMRKTVIEQFDFLE